ncbi:lipase 3-like [Pieris rapae]|uniref:lipase 3-like n=1 Tax=Pieris rapae TaxID=64459 RepID=UPI001E28071F|nr:lipase 3-like [Pieris rapae]
MLLIVATFCVLLATVGGSPNAKFVEELVKNNVFGSVSSGILEDARLDVPQLVRKYKYPLEEHHVITPDGYILTLHRIPHGRDSNTQYGNKPAVFVMHGLLCSSADWVLTGPGVGLGYILAEEGFDVWLGNNRGNYYSRRHLLLDPNDTNSTAFWKFSLDEMGNLDLSSSIDYILRTTRRPNLHYIGMSQGTTVYFVLGSLRPDFSEKIASAHMLAPVVLNAGNGSPIMDAVAPIVAAAVSWATDNGFGEIFPKSDFIASIARRYCRDGVPTQSICSALLFILGGWSESQHNATLIPVKLAHTPAGSSLRQFAHLTQNMASKKFRRYDYGPIQNMLRYGKTQPPEYNLLNIKNPVFIHYSDGDIRTNDVDIKLLYDSLDTTKELIRVPDDNFSHIDFMWGKNARSVLYDRVISEIRKIESSKIK